MKELKVSYLFKIALLFTLNVYLKSVVLLIFTFIYLLISNKRSLIIFIILFISFSFFNSEKIDYIDYAIVSEKNENYVIIDKFLYKNKIQTKDLNIGDIVKTYDSVYINDSIQLKKNIKFINTEYKKVNEFKPRNSTYSLLNSFDEETSAYLKKILLNTNTYDIDLLDIGYGFSFYYLLVLLKRKNPLLSVLLLVTYIVFLGFDIKFYLILIDLVLKKFKFSNIDILSIKIITIIFINKYLIFNYSILISLLLSIYYMSEFKYDKSYFAIFQSLFFNEINLFTLFFFKYLILIRILMFILSIVLLIIPSLTNVYLFFIFIISRFIEITSISIRGKLNMLSIILIIFISKFLKIENQYIKIMIVLIILLFPINNPFKHISFIDVGQGDSILIKGELNKYNILIDTGSKYNYYKLKRKLYSEGIYRIDYLIITHFDDDHSGNIENLKKDFRINRIITEGKDIEIGNECFKYISTGTHDNDNDNSLVYLLNIDNYKVLFTGDISKNVENRIMKENSISNIDILKVSHHGSNSASSKLFIGSCMPKFGIISTSGAYNHPHKEVIENLDNYLVNVLITKDSGTITFVFTRLIDYLITNKLEFAII